MNTADAASAPHLRKPWVQRVDQAHGALLQRWHAAPPWVRTPAAIAAGVVVLALGLLIALALVVQSVVERGEALNQAWATEQNHHAVTTTAAAGTRP